MAARLYDRIRRASPERFSAEMGLRLCGMAEDPFCPFEKNSSASRTSVRWRCLSSTENFSIEEAMIPRVVKNSAWWSLWTIWVEMEAGFNPNRLQTVSSTEGGMWAKVPTAPEIFPKLIASFALSIRRRFRFISSYQRAILRPKVMGSAWIPWDRPIIRVSLYFKAFSFKTPRSRWMSWRMRSEASLSNRAREVSRMSEEVRP